MQEEITKKCCFTGTILLSFSWAYKVRHMKDLHTSRQWKAKELSSA